MTERLTITQWAEEDRPREKMMIHGASALSNAELLAPWEGGFPARRLRMTAPNKQSPWFKN